MLSHDRSGSNCARSPCNVADAVTTSSRSCSAVKGGLQISCERVDSAAHDTAPRSRRSLSLSGIATRAAKLRLIPPRNRLRGLLALALFVSLAAWCSAKDLTKPASQPEKWDATAAPDAVLARDIAALAPQRPGHVDLCVLGVAGDGSEEVFRNEVLHLENLATRRLDAAGRVLVPANHEPVPLQRPLPPASGANLRRAKLNGANLLHADLRGADLAEADLSRATFNAATHWPEGFTPHANGAVEVRA